MQDSRRCTVSNSAERDRRVRLSPIKRKCDFGSRVSNSAKYSGSAKADISALKSPNSIYTVGSNAAKWCQGFQGALNFLSRGPNGISQVYIIILATLITISDCDKTSAAAPMHLRPSGANDHILQTSRLHYFPQSAASSQVRLEHFEKFSAEVEEEGQQERLVVKHDRLDPLRHLKRYKGGYDLKSKHYWASTLFTGIHGYVLGTLWFLGGLVGVTALYIRYYRIRKKAIQPFRKPPMISIHDSKIKLVSIILTIIFTSLIICSCGVACVGSQRFHSMAKRVETTLIVEGADNATRLIHVVTQMMGQMKVDIEPYDKGVAQRLDNTTFKLNKASISLVNIVHDHKSSLNAILLGLNIGVITLAVMNIAVWTAGLACLYLFWRLVRAFFMVFALVWLLISLNWVTFGITFSLSNFADDTCKALKEYQESPKNTTLDNVLPCNNLAIGRNTVFRFRQKIYNYIEEANNYISKRNHKQGQEKRLNEDNNKIATTNLPNVCNPFLGPPTYPPNNSCKNGTISISGLPQLLTLFKCPSKKTKGLECISTRQYNITSAYISATQKLLNLLPDVENLTGCSFLVDTFTIILQKECKPLEHSIRMVWIAMAILSTLTTLAIVLWLLKLWLLRKLNFCSQNQGGTIVPHQHSSSSP